MKERPILFSAPMVRAILAGEKTQTRRMLKRQPLFSSTPEGISGCNKYRTHSFKCPYGIEGDRLWVRENIAFGKGYDGQRPVDIPTGQSFVKAFYMADGPKPEWAGQIRPSIHMPRAWSRILLEITGVRVERLHDISDDDAKAEGVLGFHTYKDLWSNINGQESWDANPWVWVVEFKKI